VFEKTWRDPQKYLEGCLTEAAYKAARYANFHGAVDGVVDGTLWDGYIATRSKIGYFMGCG
jgi:hypothetical protein